jgi:hypothetical protein
MPKRFKRTILFEVEGEVYSDEVKPEEIIRSYNWRFKDYYDNHGESKCFLESCHSNTRGKITKLTFKSIAKPSNLLPFETYEKTLTG